VTDLFPSEEPSSSGSTDWAGSFSEHELVRPPLALLGAAYATLVLAGVCFAIPGRTFNYLGYGLAVLPATSLVMVFRAVDRKRRRSPVYAHLAGIKWYTAAPLMVSIILAVGHALFLAQTKSIA